MSTNSKSLFSIFSELEITQTIIYFSGGEQRQVQDFIEISEILPNCGIKEQCPEESFPVHIYTGQDKDDQPKLCIRGK